VGVVIVLWRRNVFLKHSALCHGDFAVVGVMSPNDLDVVEADVGFGC
jgi:hypothetical protein